MIGDNEGTIEVSKHTYTLKEAAKHCKRSEATLRLWIRQGKLIAKRESTRGNAGYVITHDDLVRALHNAGMLEVSKVSSEGDNAGVKEGVISYQADTKVSTSNTYLDQLIETLKSERDRLIQEHESDKKEIERLRSIIDTMQERIASLEREIHSLGGKGRGIIGYLREKLKR